MDETPARCLGVVGLTAGLLGAKRVVLTDQQYCLENLKVNVELNQKAIREQGSNVTVMALDWLDKDLPSGLEDVEFILGADVVWLEELIKPLVATIDRIFAQAKAVPVCFIAYQSRSNRADDILFQAMKDNRLTITGVPSSDHHLSYSSSKIVIYRIERARSHAETRESVDHSRIEG